MTQTNANGCNGNTEIERFWRHVFGGERGLLHIFTAERAADGGLPRDGIAFKNFEYPSAAKSATTWALEKAGEGREVYFCVHLLSAPKRVKANAARVHTLWGDLDGAPVPNGELSPTAVIESSPGRYHAYWRLNDSMPPETAEDLNGRIAAKIGADPSGFDLSQLLRVPGTPNRKYAGAPPVSILTLDGGGSYSAAQLDEILPRRHDAPRTPARRIGAQIPSGQRNRELTSLAGTMRRRGMGEQEIFAALEVTNRLRCTPPLKVEEVRRTVHSVAQYAPASTPWWVKVVTKND